jgi:protein TonB
LGDSEKALRDYQASVDLDGTNEAAKASLKRLQDAAAIAAAAEAAKKTPPPPPEFVNLGTISAANATLMATPIYPIIAQRALVEGKVVGDLELDENGAVVTAKAESGHQMLRSSAESAAKRSKFKPALYNSRPIKAKAQIVYNFTLKGAR